VRQAPSRSDPQLIAAALNLQFQIAALVGQLRRDAHGLGVAVAEEPCRRHDQQ
jgi:hypothetical protein